MCSNNQLSKLHIYGAANNRNIPVHAQESYPCSALIPGIQREMAVDGGDATGKSKGRMPEKVMALLSDAKL